MTENTPNCDVSSSSGLHLHLSGFPQLSGLRRDSSPPNQQEGLISRHRHSDAAAEVTEEERLPKSSHNRLTESRSGDKERTGRCFLSSAAKTPHESFTFSKMGKHHDRVSAGDQRTASDPETPS